MDNCFFCDVPNAKHKIKNRVGVEVMCCDEHYITATRAGWISLSPRKGERLADTRSRVEKWFRALIDEG
jgi:hypothetical protein